MTAADVDGFGFKDPATRRNLVFEVVPLSRLEVITHQRKPSAPHVQRLVDSIERVRFLDLRDRSRHVQVPGGSASSRSG